MKEAMGELNMTVVVVIIVAALSLFFFTVLWPGIKGNVSKDANCDAAVCNKSPNEDGITVNCHFTDKNGNSHNIVCSWKG